MADRRGIFVPLVILAFIFLSPDPARSPASQLRLERTLDDVVAQEQRQLGVIQNSTYSENGPAGLSLNVTGLESERGYAWDALPQVKERVRRQSEYALGRWAEEAALLNGNTPAEEVPLYSNVTGLLHGTWVRSQFEQPLPSPPHLNLSDYATFNAFGAVTPRAFGRNVTGEEGDMRLRFHEREHSPASILDQDVHGNVTSVDVEMTITDDSAEYDLRLLGVYFPTAGQAVLTTTSDKFAGIFALPHLTLSERMFATSRTLLNETISRVIARQADRDTEKLNPWSPTIEGAGEALVPLPDCEMIMYLQQLPPTSTTTTPLAGSSMLSFLERELRFPTGAILPPVPEMRFSMLIFSPDCGYVLESKGPPDFFPQDATHLTGPKLEVLHNNGRHHLLFFTTVLSLQLALLMRQMREASTPSTRSRISLYTVSIMALGDGFTFMAFLLTSFFVGALWVGLMATAFVAFVGVSFFGMRFLMDIWVVQAPERAARRREEAEEEARREERYRANLQRILDQREARRAREAGLQTARTDAGVTSIGGAIVPGQQTGLNDQRTETNNTTTPEQIATHQQPPSGAPAPALQQTPPGLLPLPVTAQRPTDNGATPVFMPSDQSGLEPVALPGAGGQPTTFAMSRESFASVYTKFYLLLLGTLFLSLNAASWSLGLRRIYFTTLGLIYLGFWVPQINRNVQRNCRKAFKWEFVLGQSALRLMPFVYLYGFKHNVLFAQVDYISLTLLAGWVWIQILALGSQELIGPRWFVKKDWAPPAYDYHPVLREDEEGATMPIGFSQATASVSDDSGPGSPVAGRERRSGSQSSRRGSLGAKEAKEKGKRIFDCAICMQDLEVPVIESGGSGDNLTGPAGLLARRSYMVTPCRHIFHSACLEGWLKYRLQCPICRETLPPL